jgi:putative transferase (TIGR04331 family)
LPTSPEFAFSHNAFLRHDAFKLWAADRATSAGTRLVGAQHGGGYGVYLHDNWTGMHEDASLDRFLTWGWSNAPHHVPVGVQIDRPVTPDPNGGLLLVLGPLVRMSNNLTLLQCSHIERQMHLVKSFVESLPAHIRGVTTLRPKAAGPGTPARIQTSDFAAHHLSVPISDGSPTLQQELAHSRLAVVLYNETTLPINLSIDFPTIALWQSSLTRLNETATPIYEQLSRAGILHHDPIACATHLRSIWGDVSGWWNSAHVSRTRRQMAETFAGRCDRQVHATAARLAA